MDGVITRGVVFLAELRQLSTTGAFLNIWKIEEDYLVNGDRNLPGSHDKVDNDITRKPANLFIVPGEIVSLDKLSPKN